MSQTDDNTSQHELADGRSSVMSKEGDHAHDQGRDTAEEAVDTSSPRSLTSRTASLTKSPEPKQRHSTGSGSSKTSHEHRNGFAENGTAEEDKRTKSSSDDSKRLSDTLDLDNVNLDDETPTKDHAKEKASDTAPAENAPKAPGESTMSLSSITNAWPSMPWSPPAGSPSKSPDAALAGLSSPPVVVQQPPSRKLTSPFSWLSRTSTAKDKENHTSPPNTARRNTASSIATLTSNPEMMLSKLNEEDEAADGVHESIRNSLKDRFKLLRMREEAGIPPQALDDKSDSAIASLARSNTAAIGLAGLGESAMPNSMPPTSPVPVANASLAPGTVSGVNAGPSALAENQVDWDLWQSVVYEGPTAVARTGADELNRAIASGIPSAIRGVIWQVLAQSKNEDLEESYHSLVARGTDKNDHRSSRSTAGSLSRLSTNAGEQASVSSGSSVHSEPVEAASRPASPTKEQSPEALAKAQAADLAARKQETAAIQKLEKTIRRDLGARTSFSKYTAAAGLQDGLFGVCKAYALYDEGVGYAQGMNFLIMPLLFNMPEQEAFCLLARLMNHYHLRDLFIQDMPGLHLRLYQFERLLEEFEPALYCHLHRRSISPHLYATQWFLTLFAYRFPLQLVLRIYDLILSEGLSAILRFGIVLMQRNSTTLLGLTDMQQLTSYLKDKLFDIYIDKDPSQGSLLESGFFGSSSSSMEKEVYRADQLVLDACEVKITPEMLKQYTAEWEEKTRTDRSRETEMQELRAANQSYGIQVRKLEERVEACDREQAGLATELVHTKVENQELKDQNEGLKGQVRELQIVIEKQPLEIEEAWKLERDDLMKRNFKVHEENEKLEKELADLEEQLVQTKMQYAEINSQHETLTRKWSELKRQFA